MPSATTVGVLVGLSVMMYANRLQKRPLLRHPSKHLLGMCLGAILANQTVKWDIKCQQDRIKAKEAWAIKYKEQLSKAKEPNAPENNGD